MASVITSAGAAGITDHGDLTGLLDDDHSQYLLLAGRAGGQSAFGGTLAGNNLTLQGNATASLGLINMNSPIVFGPYEPSGALYGFTYTATEAFTAAFVGGGLNFSGTISFTNAIFIYESFRGSPHITSLTTPGFAAYTVLQALPRFTAGTVAGRIPLPPLIINAGATLESSFFGTMTTANSFGMNFAPQTRALAAFATMAVTNQTGITVRPTFSTVGASVASLGTIRGVHQQNPGVALFQPQLGTETMVANIGLDVDNIAFGGNVTKAAVRSAQLAATNAYFLLQTGTARSSFGSSNIEFNDLFGLVLGTSQDATIAWAGGASSIFFQFTTSNTDQLHFSNPSNGRLLLNGGAGGASLEEINLNFDRFSLGAQAGAVGNQIGVFVAGAHTVTVGGEFSQFLLTQAANGTVDAALGLYAGWTINAPTPTIGTGSVTTAVGLNVGGNPNVGTNRAGVRIISNPTGGAGVNAALWVTAGVTRLDGRLDINNGIALGGGAAATLGTIGGAGPTAAAQAQWVEIDIGGVAHWIPVWT